MHHLGRQLDSNNINRHRMRGARPKVQISGVLDKANFFQCPPRQCGDKCTAPQSENLTRADSSLRLLEIFSVSLAPPG
jgi:hypothetical protein